MKIQLNGELIDVHSATLNELITEMSLQERLIAIEKNLEVIPKSLYAQTPIEIGDRIEIVHMIGGG
ncbi:MAG: sulfur carrier protein ThiS [Mariprofundaceae bacterium]|nr:sulfur carrier protein ThiS [Mariprofundaceae bacterium]